jgi:hypothetical protein
LLLHYIQLLNKGRFANIRTQWVKALIGSILLS